jgi:hypothetical protein
MVLNPLPISRRIVKPSNCVLAFGIPTSREGFYRALDSPHADFVKRFLGGWPQYHAQFVVDVEIVEPILCKLGVTTIHDATLADFARVVDQSFDVIILFSHWHADAVEFRSGFESVRSLLSAIPSAFAGVLDLCVCHPMTLVSALHRHRPGCIVKYLPTEAAPHYWMYFYRTLFSQLQSRDLTYLTAIQEVACAFLDAALPPQRELNDA